MKLKGLAVLALLCLVLGTFSVDATATNECGRNPSSVLLYPYYNTYLTNLSVMTITNVCQEDVWVHIVWVPKKDCSPNNLWLELSAYDTVTFTDRALGFQNNSQGFFYAVAVDANYSTTKIDKDCLIGQTFIFEDNPNTDNFNIVAFGINAVGFQALAVDNSDEVIHLDGVEYTLAPRRLYFPRFLGQPDALDPRGFFGSEVVFVNLTGGMRFDAQIKATIYNDNEVAMSEYVDIPCWAKRPLNKMTLNTNATWNSFLLMTDHNTSEPIGFSDVETGWICMEGTEAWNHDNPIIRIDNANVYTVLIEVLGDNNHGIADLPWGLEDADFNNAALWPVSQLGD